MSKLWGGRFEKETHREVEEFTSSLAVDSRLWRADIRGSIAHARMLAKVGVLSAEEGEALVHGLEQVLSDIAEGGVTFRADAEDIHSEIERLLTEKAGAVAGKLHTGRSRNDQVVTATRLYLREEIQGLTHDLRKLQARLLETAEGHVETVMPGLTHLQHAQPVSLAHHLMAYFWMLERDNSRLVGGSERLNVMPLGSAALAGTSYPLDRAMVARELGFSEPSQNSLDAVSDRDFVIEFLSSSSLVMTHLSQLAQELTLWSTPEFGFVELDDSVTTGSSIMPQKKNPDVAELIRGRVGRVTGALVGALTMMKAMPLSYNRDFQEDKTFLFEGLDTVRSCVRLMALMLENAKFNTERMKKAVSGDFSNATDLADYLVRKGMPFRQCHEVVGKVVRHCIVNGKALEAITLEELRKFSALFDADVLPQLDPAAVMQARTTAGGTSPASVRAQFAKAKELLKPVAN